MTDLAHVRAKVIAALERPTVSESDVQEFIDRRLDSLTRSLEFDAELVREPIWNEDRTVVDVHLMIFKHGTPFESLQFTFTGWDCRRHRKEGHGMIPSNTQRGSPLSYKGKSKDQWILTAIENPRHRGHWNAWADSELGLATVAGGP